MFCVWRSGCGGCCCEEDDGVVEREVVGLGDVNESVCFFGRGDLYGGWCIWWYGVVLMFFNIEFFF